MTQEEKNISQKPVHAKPSLYAHYFIQLKDIAKDFGYNLVLHGSMNRDLDLIAIPWIDDPKDEFEMIKEFDRYINGIYSDHLTHYLFSVLPGSRNSYVVNVNRGGAFNNYLDELYYIDISVTPLKKTMNMKKISLLLILSISSLFAFSQVTVSLNGSGSSDPDGTITAFLWRQVSGTNVSIANPTSVTPSIIFTVPGVYKFGLVVTDNQGLKSLEDTVVVTINAAPIRPKASAGPDQNISLPTVKVKTIDINKDVAWLRRY